MISPPPNQQSIQDANGKITYSWVEFTTEVYIGIKAAQTSGTTAQRPIKNLWIGRQYFDTTLGYSINLKSVKPNVWVNGAEVAV